MGWFGGFLKGGKLQQLGALPGWEGLGMMLGFGLLPRFPNSCHGRMNFAASGGQDKFCIALPALLILAISLPCWEKGKILV